MHGRQKVKKLKWRRFGQLPWAWISERASSIYAVRIRFGSWLWLLYVHFGSQFTSLSLIFLLSKMRMIILGCMIIQNTLFCYIFPESEEHPASTCSVNSCWINKWGNTMLLKCRRWQVYISFLFWLLRGIWQGSSWSVPHEDRGLWAGGKD